MILKAEQINQLLEIINKNQAIVIGRELGTEFLTHQDKQLLQRSGVDIDGLYDIGKDTLNLQFQLGMLAQSLGAAKTAKLTYAQLKEYVQHGDYIPLTAREVASIDAIRNQTFTDLRKLGSNIFQDVNQVLTDKSLKGQRQLIREELETGFLNKDTVTEIAHGIAERTGDWSRDFERIVAYNSHLAFEQGKAAMIQRDSGEDDPTVYKTVFDGACNHCISLYLTSGIGSQPRLFKLSELRANGTNIGRKTVDWLGTLGPIHPFCRCLVNYLPKGYVWDKDKKKFVAPTGDQYKSKRKPIRVWIGGTETYI
jgi:hypothetical protein